MTDSAMMSLSKGAPLTRRPAAELVVERLLELIQTGSLKAGDTLPTEQEIGAALQVSRPVVREALRGLQILGVVETRQGGRCSVTDLKPERLAAPVQLLIALDERNIDSIYEARMVVEGELLALGAERADASAIDHLDHMVREGFRLTADPLAFRVLDLEFHQTLVALANNPFLERTARSFYHAGTEFRRIASETPGVLNKSAEEHERIVDAVRQHDPQKARSAMRDHLTSIAKTTAQAMKSLAVKN